MCVCFGVEGVASCATWGWGSELDVWFDLVLWSSCCLSCEFLKLFGAGREGMILFASAVLCLFVTCTCAAGRRSRVGVLLVFDLGGQWFVALMHVFYIGSSWYLFSIKRAPLFAIVLVGVHSLIKLQSYVKKQDSKVECTPRRQLRRVPCSGHTTSKEDHPYPQKGPNRATNRRPLKAHNTNAVRTVQAGGGQQLQSRTRNRFRAAIFVLQGAAAERERNEKKSSCCKSHLESPPAEREKTITSQSPQVPPRFMNTRITPPPPRFFDGMTPAEANQP